VFVRAARPRVSTNASRAQQYVDTERNGAGSTPRLRTRNRGTFPNWLQSVRTLNGDVTFRDGFGSLIGGPRRAQRDAPIDRGAILSTDRDARILTCNRARYACGGELSSGSGCRPRTSVPCGLRRRAENTRVLYTERVRESGTPVSWFSEVEPRTLELVRESRERALRILEWTREHPNS